MTLNIKRNFAYKYFLINRTENICDITSNKKSTPLIDLIIEPLKKYSNFVQKCPFSGNISIVHVPITSVNTPAFVPAGDYRIDARLFNEKNLTIFFYRSYVTVEAKGIDQLLVG